MAQTAYTTPSKDETQTTATSGARTDKWKAQLDEWKTKVDQYKTKLDKAVAEAKLDAEEELRDYRAREWEFRAKLRGIKESSGEVAQELRDGLEKAWGELNTSFDKAMKKARS